jgi:peptide/nickel transport system ATP-binding protein
MAWIAPAPVVARPGCWSAWDWSRRASHHAIRTSCRAGNARGSTSRALAYSPRLLILDEAVSALDKSVEAQVLNLLNELKAELGLTYMFISHDLHVVRYMSDRIMVMYLGKVVEIGPADRLWHAARHPYTRALLGSMPPMDPHRRITRPPLEGDPPSPIDPPPGCRFHTRCPRATAHCARQAPELQNHDPARPDHLVACHFPVPITAAQA